MARPNDPNEIAIASPGRGTAIALGIVLLIVGVLAIFFSYTATVALTLLVGALLIISGLIQLFDAFSRRSAGDTLLELFIGVISLVAGAIILFSPGTGIFALTVVLGAFFGADGVIRLIFAFRRESYGRRGWLIFGGILSLVLAALILFGLPGTAGFTVGLLFGVHALFLGFSFLVLGGRRTPGERELA